MRRVRRVRRVRGEKCEVTRPIDSGRARVKGRKCGTTKIKARRRGGGRRRGRGRKRKRRAKRVNECNSVDFPFPLACLLHSLFPAKSEFLMSRLITLGRETRGGPGREIRGEEIIHPHNWTQQSLTTFSLLLLPPCQSLL